VSQTASTVIETSQVLFDDKPLPDGWRRVKLRDVIREAQGGFASGERDASGIVQLRMNNVTTSGQFDWSSYIRVPASSETVQMYKLESGDVLFNNTNSTELVGKSALFEGYDEPVVFSNHFTRLRTDASLLEPCFLASWLQHQWQCHVFADICNRWIGQSAVQRDKLLALEILLPSLPEQERIAEILRKRMAAVEQARAAAAAQLKAAKDLPTAYLRKVFDTPEVKQWQRKKLRDICNEIYRYPSFYGMEHLKAGVPVIRGEHINDKGEISQDWNNYWFVSEDVSAKFPRTILREGDLVFTVRGTIGKVGIIRQSHNSAQLSPNLIRISPSSSVESLYLWYYLQTIKGGKEAVEDNAVTIATVKASDLVMLEIPLPSLLEQQQIVAVLNEQTAFAEKAQQSLKDQLDLINKLPAALLRQAFTGKL
jgi:Restriction endonuclease S subunits